MRTPLTIESLANALRDQVAADQDRHITDPAHPAAGAFIDPTSGLPADGHTAIAALHLGYVALVDSAADAPAALDAAIDYLLRSQRPTGRIDLHSANYDSGPDTAFVVHRLSGLVEIARLRGVDWPVFAPIETFIRRAVPGILNGGFHTPNHRWVICAALTQAAALYPDLDVGEVVESYLAEGFDIDSEGAYIERSVGIYDAVTDQALLCLADHWPDPAVTRAAHAAVAANIAFDQTLLHADGTADTGLSRRQDFGTRSVPTALIGPLLHYAAVSADPAAAQLAAWLWRQAAPHDLTSIYWALYALLKFADRLPNIEPYAAPPAVNVFYPHNRVWRFRRDALSVSAYGDTTTLLKLVHGTADLSALSIAQSYFGVGRFVADSMTSDGNGIMLTSSGTGRLHKPGYEMPLGRPVPPEQWVSAFAERDYMPVPPAASALRIMPQEDGLACHYRTTDGLAGVTTQIAFDFPAGGIWETDDTRFMTQPGQVIFLKRGAGWMHYGSDSIGLDPGAHAHHIAAMRDIAGAPPGHVRVLLTFLTPVDFTFTLRLR